MRKARNGPYRYSTLQTAVLVAACLVSPIAAYAQEATTVTCVAAGRNYQPGDIACIPACHGQQRLARCEQTGTGVSWTNISQSCPNARNLNVSPVPFALANYSGNTNWSEGTRLMLN